MPTRPQIINHMLRTLGEGGVSYDQSLHPTVQLCNNCLDVVSSEVQGRGWWFNKEYNLTLVPDNRGEVIVPPEALDMTISSVVNMGPGEKRRFVRRDNRIYDTIKHSYEIGHNVVVDVTLLLAIDDVPSQAQSYIQHKAAETIFLDEDGDPQKLSKLEQRTMLAWQGLQAQQLKNISTNALDRQSAAILTSGWRPAGQGRNPNFIGGRIR